MKEIPTSSLPSARIQAIEAVCAIEDTFPRTILTTQLHLIVHLVDEVAIAGVVHARWMFYLERFLKTLKDFVRQRARPEGSMAEGWLVQESFVYISEYLSQVDPRMPRLWSNEIDARMESNVPQGKGRVSIMKRSMMNKVNAFCIISLDIMKKWVDRYTLAKQRRVEERESFIRDHRRGRARKVPLPSHLSLLPKNPTNEWLYSEMVKASNEGEEITLEEWEYARGCLPKVFL